MTQKEKIESNGLLEIVARLEAATSNSADRVSIAVETDLDEAFFVGTRSGFIRLAAALMRAAAADELLNHVGGLPCRWSTFTHEVADGLAQVVAGAECLVASEEQRRQVAEHYRVIAGDKE